MTFSKLLFVFKNLWVRVDLFLKRQRFYFLGFFTIFLPIDLFFHQAISDTIFLFLIVFWLINVYTFRIKPKQNLILATFFYVIAFFFQFFNQSLITEKAVSWFFIFITLAIIQLLIKKKAVDESSF